MVLLVDDSVDVHRLLQVRLRHEQIRLVGTTKPAEGLAMARKERPSVILLDLDMPEVDGFELLRRIKDDTAINNVPVIVLSAPLEQRGQGHGVRPGRHRLRHQAIRPGRAEGPVTGRVAAGQPAAPARRAGRRGRTHQPGKPGPLQQAVGREVRASARRYPNPLSLAMVDIDFFKRINDTYGHPAGDEVLQGVAKLLQGESRTPDVPCRFGGEEFALIMPSTGPSDALIVADRIREAAAEGHLAAARGTPGHHVHRARGNRRAHR